MTKNKGISLVITDMDKTLLNDQGEISERNLSYIRMLKKHNIKFGIATGRSKHSLYKFLDKYQLKEQVDYVISMNGVSFYDAESEKSVDFGYVDEKIICEVYNKFKDYDVSFAVHDHNDLICSKRTKYTDIECRDNYYNVIVEEDFTKIINKKYPKLMFIGAKEVLDEIYNKLSELSEVDFNFFKSNDIFLEIVKKDVSKGNALMNLCRLKGIKISKVVAFGDNLNDMDMIRYSGFGVAVENANEEIKLHANFITKSNNEDGFAHGCCELIEFKIEN